MTEINIERPQRWEWLGVLGLLAGLLAFNVASYNYYPAVWCDEALYSEPAINLVRHGSYITVGYEFQPPKTFPIVNCPLYGMALVPWLMATGTSLLAARSFNYTLMMLAAFLIWSISWRFGVVRSAIARLLMVVVLDLGYGMSYCYRSCRPDILGMVCLLLLLLAFKIGRPRLRGLCLAALAAASVWIGLQVAVFAGFACFVGGLMFGRQAPRHTAVPGLNDLVLLALGTALGAGSLVLFMHWKGMLAWFLPPILGIVKGSFYSLPTHHSLGGTLVHYLQRTIPAYWQDFSTAALTPVLLLLITVARQCLSPVARKVVLYCFVLAFGAPALFEAIGHFAFYYSYLRYVPAVLALFVAGSDLCRSRIPPSPQWYKPAFVLSVAGAIVVGLPMRLGLSLGCCNLAPRAEVQRLLKSLITPEDTVFSEYLLFFEVKQIAPVVYHPYASSVLTPAGLSGSDLTPEAKQAVSVLVIRPEQKYSVSSFFGGQWQPVSEPFGDTQDFTALTRLPIIGRKFASYAAQPQTERFQLQVFRRVPNSAGAFPSARGQLDRAAE